MTPLELWSRALACYPDRVAVTDADGNWTYQDLERLSLAVAEALSDQGVRSGDRVATVAPNGARVLGAYLGIWKAGATAVPVTPGTADVVQAEHVRRAGAKVVLTTGAAVRGVPPEVTALVVDDRRGGREVLPAPVPGRRKGSLACCFLTSATTGRAKLVGIGDHHLAVSIVAQLATMTLPRGTSMVVCNPLSHGSMYFPLSVLLGGGRLVIPTSVTPQAILAAMAREAATHVWLVPETLRFLLRARGLEATDLSALREVVYAAAPMPPELLLEARRTLRCGFRQIYGMTEALLVATLAPEEHRFDDGILEERALPVGRSVPGMVVSVQDDPGQPLPFGKEGRICVSGDAIVDGYLSDADSSAAQAEGEASSPRSGRWLLTSDTGWIDREGFVHLTGRASDVIVRGGQKIAPVDVESVLKRHPGVRDAAVVGAPDPDWGEVPHAFIVPNDDHLDPAEVIRFCVSRLSAYQRPQQVHLIPALPKTPTGKILRRRLKDELPIR